MISGYLDDKGIPPPVEGVRHRDRKNTAAKDSPCVSTGIGTDNIDIVMNELDALANIDFRTREIKQDRKSLNILRIGTSGAVQPDIPIGSFVFSHISVGCDGLMNWYAGRDSISIADMEEAFKKHTGWAKHLPGPVFRQGRSGNDIEIRGLHSQGHDNRGSRLLRSQGRVLRMPLAMPDMLDTFGSFRYGDWRITNFEMEGSAIAGIAAHLDAALDCAL